MTKNVNSTTFIYEDLLEKILINFKGFILSQLSDCCTEIDDALFNLADKAISNQLQSSYFESMKLIRSHKKQFLIDFESSLIIVFESFKRNDFNYFKSFLNQYDQNNQASELELIEDLKLDESLAQLNIIQKSEAAYHKHLYAFEKRFSFLVDHQKLEINQLPVSPFVLVTLFSKTIRSIDVEIEVKKLMYSFFERFVMGQLNDVYSKINEIFISNGIIKDLKYDLSKIRKQQNTENKKHNTTNEFNRNEKSNPVSYSQENLQNYINKSPVHQNLDQNFQLISKLLQLSHQALSNKQNASHHVNIKSIDVQLMINALSLLQDNLFNTPENLSAVNQKPINLKQRLYSKLAEINHSESSVRINQRDEDIIDLVSLLFQFVVDDRNLPPPIQAVLAKLQFPYLKLALKDRNLFADKNHDARILLDKMASASIGWAEESDYRNVLITKLNEITNHILQAKAFNNKIFEILILNFDEFLARLNRKVQINLKRTKEKVQGQEKVESAKQQVAKILYDKMNNQQMPDFIRTLLISEWADVLVLMHLSSAHEQSEINRKIEFIDYLIDFSQPGFESGEFEMNLIIKRYECGLKYISYHPLELEKKVTSLKAFLRQLSGRQEMQNTKLDNMVGPNNIFSLSSYRSKKFKILKYIKQVGPKGIVEQLMNSKNLKHFKILSSLNEGEWLEFDLNKGEPIRGQYAGVSNFSGKVLFVNLRGLMLFERDVEIVANGLASNQVRVIKDEALFDRALSSIAYDLTNNQN